jgi:hypothetical protein
MKEEILVSPALYPVKPEWIATLESVIPVPSPLKAFWEKSGYGFFNENANGELVSEDIVNRLIDPVEVAELLQQPSDLSDEFIHGIPFFERNDRRYLLIDPRGRVISADVDVRVVSSGFDEFMHRIVRDPFFYDDDVRPKS